MTIRKVLLIEDDSEDQLVFNMVLSEIFPGADCRTVSNGCEGVGAILDGTSPEIIFLDLNMPVMNGYEFLEKYADLKCGAPVVVLTTSSDKGDITRSEILGARGFMTKPTDFQSFRNALRRIFAHDFSFSTAGLQIF